ncbi:hypothetical protein A2363_04770 [Candidatus Gottesmanbacteria bacterium RIFOXYB1_FULL_47_11]|uniref:Uncharacterized protein n=1 Tax=Candidatus Gottesmanbacteria bacterium RIFOXYB1_FULL_47_11 TaxID=1798401 RepID=A0A1F6BC09_9BACT|nr:MAG: hypothetical protein A2363_04770 [Candidatus Gottesmanbacteria bacterium RIFOXYB1_FULL_47_11]
MKPQDTVFFFLLVGLILVRKPRLFLVSGLVCWVLSIPLFAKWIFFTAERLTWYGVAFVLIYLLIRYEK